MVSDAVAACAAGAANGAAMAHSVAIVFFRVARDGRVALCIQAFTFPTRPRHAFATKTNMDEATCETLERLARGACRKRRQSLYILRII
jgi:hypothetical protein